VTNAQLRVARAKRRSSQQPFHAGLIVKDNNFLDFRLTAAMKRTAAMAVFSLRGARGEKLMEGFIAMGGYVLTAVHYANDAAQKSGASTQPKAIHAVRCCRGRPSRGLRDGTGISLLKMITAPWKPCGRNHDSSEGQALQECRRNA